MQYNKTSITESKIEKPARLYRLPCEKSCAALPPPVRKGWRGFAASCAERLARLCRLPCGKPLAFRHACDFVGGYAARGEASPGYKLPTESRRLSAREAAKPQSKDHFKSKIPSNQRSLQRSLLTAHFACLEPFVTDTNLTGPSNPELLNVCDAPKIPPAGGPASTFFSGAAVRSPMIRFVHSFVTLICK